MLRLSRSPAVTGAVKQSRCSDGTIKFFLYLYAVYSSLSALDMIPQSPEGQRKKTNLKK